MAACNAIQMGLDAVSSMCDTFTTEQAQDKLDTLNIASCNNLQFCDIGKTLFHKSATLLSRLWQQNPHSKS